jgi:hypothetical protein
LFDQLILFLKNNQDELVKRKIADAQMAAHEPTSNNLEVMAAQVKEILPHVPLATIIRDLGMHKINYS